ncbi:MAG: hypothetical protein QNJ54_26270 [Prochloraceae cyanobacterium]|nr:hypothetical protein [Prochloraceae cyanobacterium]
MHDRNPSNIREIDEGGCLITPFICLFLVFLFLYLSFSFSLLLASLIITILGVFCTLLGAILGQIIEENTPSNRTNIDSIYQFFISSSTRISSPNQSQSSTYTVSLANVPDDIDNILENLAKGEIKDPVTQEAFIPGETVYLCLSHRLAYHQDSWQEIGYKCICCNHSHHVEIYIIPPCQVTNNFNKKDDLSNLIKFEDSQ